MHDAIRTIDGRQVRYAERDPIGVEGPVETHRRGMNAELAYLRDQHAAQTLEHDENGIHRSTRIARIFIDARHNPKANVWETTSRCYARGTYSDGVAEVVKTGVGTFEVQLHVGASPDTHYRISDATARRVGFLLDSNATAIAVRMGTINSEDNFEVLRYEGPAGSMVLADGDLQFTLYSES